MATINPEELRNLMQDMFKRHQSGERQSSCKVFEVQLPPQPKEDDEPKLTQEELRARIRETIERISRPKNRES